MDWGIQCTCRRSTMPEAQRPVPGSLFVTGHSPVRVQGGQRLVARRTAPAGAFRSATERSEALSAEIGRNSTE